MNILFYFFFGLNFFFVFFMGVFLNFYTSYVLDFFIPFGGFSDFSLSFCFDYYSLLFFSVVSFVSSVVFYYSGFYMGVSDFNSKVVFDRFFIILFLFVVSMFFLVFSFSWVSVMLGWDGLGVVSFLLVVYYNNSSSLDSGLVTIFTNRLGDCFFIFSFVFMSCCGWFSFGFMSVYGLFFFAFVIFLGCITKSAQFPFSSWLPFAMAAPTPVSSLVHSSTLVTAGIFVLYRFNYLLSSSFFFMGLVSLFTMFMGGLCSMVEIDFKKLVAMSTLSQLGFMIYSLSLGMYGFCFLHMTFHAFFKSMLFLSTGSIMHLLGGDQDSRNFGSFSDSFFVKVFFNVSCLCLMGFPFTLGFYSKDVILGFMFSESFTLGGLVFFLSCCFTVSYSLRIIYMASFMFPSFFSSLSYTESSDFFFPLFLIFFFMVFFGNFFMYFFLPVSFFSFYDFFLGFIIIIIGFFLFKIFGFSYFLFSFFSFMGFISMFSTSFMSRNFKSFSFNIDSLWVEVLGPKGFTSFFIYFYSIFVNFYFSYMWGVFLLVIFIFFNF